MQNMTIKEAAHQHRLRQAGKLLSLFEDAHGRAARTMKELEAWVGSLEGKAATAYDRTPDGKIIPDVAGQNRSDI
jgi:hypothetical protein